MKKLIISCLVSLVLIATMTAPVVADEVTEGSLGASVTVKEVMSLTVVDNGTTGISFGDLDEGIPDNPDLAQTDVLGAVTLEVGVETNVAVDLQTKGTGDFDGPGTATILLGNATWHNSDSSGDATPMTTTYTTVGSLIAGGGDVNVWHWLSIPEDQEAGTYTTNFYYQVIAQP